MNIRHFVTKNTGSAFFLFAIILAACSPAAPALEENYPAPVLAAKESLIESLGVETDQIDVISSEQVNWSDSCLDLADTGEMCLQAITPGWRIVLGANDDQYEFHTDNAGETIRQLPVDTPETAHPAVLAVMQHLNNSLGISIDQIEIVSFKQVNWSDSCLDLAEPGEMCLQVISPGWEITLNANGNQYEFHTDQNGKTIRQFQPKFEVGFKPDEEYPKAVEASIENLREKLQIDNADQVAVVSFEKVDWRNSCLGMSAPGEMCLQAITPGWQVVLSAGGQTYIFHTDSEGERLRQK